VLNPLTLTAAIPLQKPLQVTGLEDVFIVLGKGVTVTDIVAVLEQAPFTPVTVYVVLIVGVAVTLALVDEFKLAEGAQVYDVALLLALKLVVAPLHIVVGVALAVIVNG
jgi:hypothetical protein